MSLSFLTPLVIVAATGLDRLDRVSGAIEIKGEQTGHVRFIVRDQDTLRHAGS